MKMGRVCPGIVFHDTFPYSNLDKICWVLYQNAPQTRVLQ